MAQQFVRRGMPEVGVGLVPSERRWRAGRVVAHHRSRIGTACKAKTPRGAQNFGYEVQVGVVRVDGVKPWTAGRAENIAPPSAGLDFRPMKRIQQTGEEPAAGRDVPADSFEQRSKVADGIQYGEIRRYGVRSGPPLRDLPEKTG
jgi:hypothetical protein